MTKKDVIKIVAILFGIRVTVGIIYKILYSIKQRHEEELKNERREKELTHQKEYYDEIMNQLRSNMETST